MSDPNHLDPRRRDAVSPASVGGTPTDASLQDQIRAVRAQQVAGATGATGGRQWRRPTSKVVVGGALVAGIIALWQFGPRFGWGPGGRGPGDGGGTAGDTRNLVIDNAQTANSAQRPATPQRPLRVTIDGNRYLVEGNEVDLATITRMAGEVPAGEGPAIEVKRNETSRVKAEQDLKGAVEKAGVPATWMPPLE